MDLIFYITAFLYLLFFIGWMWGIIRIVLQKPFDIEYRNDFKIAVVVCARNESDCILNLLASIQNQSITKDKFSLYVINDASEDETGKLVDAFLKQNSGLNGKVITNPVAKGKKTSISDFIPTLLEEVVFTTDADCVLGLNVLELVYSVFQNEQTQLVSGPVLLGGKSGTISGFQEIEFFSLIASGAAFIGMALPVMCNGANLAYRKSAYLSSKPYADNLKISSGDDVFLLHAIKRNFGAKSIKFLLNAKAEVYTRKMDSIKGFFHQRLRWGAKSSSYTDGFSVWVAIFVFLVNVAMIACYFDLIINGFHRNATMLLLIVKFVTDFVFLSYSAYILKKFIDPITYLTTQILLPFYIVFVGLFSQILSFNWKGKVYKK